MADVKGPMMGSGRRTSGEIRDEIRRTRAHVDATVEAIEQKLSPGELMYEAWSLFRGGSGSSMNRIWRIARQHPLPTAVIGLGLGWMAYESAGGRERPGPRARHMAGYRGAEGWPGEVEEPGAFESARQGRVAAARSAMDKASETAGNVGASMRRTAEAAAEAGGELAGQARHMASQAAGSMRRQASELGRQASELGEQARGGFWQALEEQPLVVGAAALASGLLAGLLLPSTQREDALMGESRDALLHEARGIGQEVLEQGRQVASTATETFRQSAEAQGVDVEAATETMRGIGRDVAEGLTPETERLRSESRPDPPGMPRHEAPPPRDRAA